MKYVAENNSGIHILQDLSGGKVRVSNKLVKIIKVYDNEEIIFCGKDTYEELLKKQINKKIIPLNITTEALITSNLEKISMKDNTIHFSINKVRSEGVHAKVIKGGIIRAGKGCNITGYKRDNSKLSVIVKKDLMWGIENKVDIICQSYVEKKEDILCIRKYIKNENENYKPKIWAKIETENGVKNIEDILKIVDGIIVGRGDLIPETSLIRAPILQEKIIDASIKNNKDVILGTHILNSMKNGKVPELSEVESIYYSIKKGVSGFLLAGETAVGKAPIKTVQFLHRLIERYECEKK